MNRGIQMLATAAVLLVSFNMEAPAPALPHMSGGGRAGAPQGLRQGDFRGDVPR